MLGLGKLRDATSRRIPTHLPQTRAMSFPTPQEKPARRLNYQEKARAGLVVRKPRQSIARVSKKNAARDREYREWVAIAMHGVRRCAKCRHHKGLEPHHAFGRTADNLFKVVPLCRLCHAWCHEFPNMAFEQGWLQPEYRGVIRQPNHPQPFTLLTYP